MKYYAIGDLHGRFDLLEKSVRKILAHGEGSVFQIITLGDYIDRGPQSRQVIQYLMDHPEIIALRGNHEDICAQTCATGIDPSWWMGNGGDKTMMSYGQKFMGGHYYHGADVYTSLVPDEHVKWMASRPLYYETEKQVFVHAGIHDTEAPLEQQQFDARSDGALYMNWMLYGPSDHGGWRGKHVVHGHHQFADGPHVWQPGSKGGGRTNLDTFAFKSGLIVVGVFDDEHLTAIDYIEVTDHEDDLREDGSSLDPGKTEAVG